MKQILKTLSLRVVTKRELKIVSDFQSVAIYLGKGVQESILELMEGYSRFNKPEFDLVSETELMDRCRKLGYPTTQGTIKVYRRRGVLQDKDGLWFFKNDEGKVRYNWPKMKEFLKDRKENPNSRINNGE